jgi:two-component system cell cycle sensor histidine kinase/response regulator CckA
MILQEKEYWPGGSPFRDREQCLTPGTVNKQFRVLVMDDDETTRAVISVMLAQLGCLVAEAIEGEEAIRSFTLARDSGNPFDAVLLDLTVPSGMGGREALQKLVSIDPAVKAVVITGNTTNPAFADFRAFGFTGALAKPFSTESLVTVLREAVAPSDCP